MGGDGISLFVVVFFGCVVRFFLSSWTEEGEIGCRENVSKQRKNEFDGLLVVFTFFEWWVGLLRILGLVIRRWNEGVMLLMPVLMLLLWIKVMNERLDAQHEQPFER